MTDYPEVIRGQKSASGKLSIRRSGFRLTSHIAVSGPREEALKGSRIVGSEESCLRTDLRPPLKLQLRSVPRRAISLSKGRSEKNGIKRAVPSRGRHGPYCVATVMRAIFE